MEQCSTLHISKSLPCKPQVPREFNKTSEINETTLNLSIIKDSASPLQLLLLHHSLKELNPRQRLYLRLEFVFYTFTIQSFLLKDSQFSTCWHFQFEVMRSHLKQFLLVKQWQHRKYANQKISFSEQGTTILKPLAG